MRLSFPDRLKMNREMVAEQCPAQLPALTASTHIKLYKKDANFVKALSLRFVGALSFQALQLLIHYSALSTATVQVRTGDVPASGFG